MYLPKNYQYTSHVAGERYSMWNWSDGASLVDINYRCLTNTHWSGQRHLRHSHSANKSAGALIETPVSILQIAAIGSCDLVPLPYWGINTLQNVLEEQYALTERTSTMCVKTLKTFRPFFVDIFFNCMFMPRKDVGSKILSFVMIDYLEMQPLDN